MICRKVGREGFERITEEVFAKLEINQDKPVLEYQKSEWQEVGNNSEKFCKSKMNNLDWSRGVAGCYSLENTKQLFFETFKEVKEWYTIAFDKEQGGILLIDVNFDFDDNADFTDVVYAASANDGTLIFSMITAEETVKQFAWLETYLRAFSELKDGDKLKVTLGTFVTFSEVCESPDPNRPFLTHKTTCVIPYKVEKIGERE